MSTDYKIFQKFIKRYLPSGFSDINQNDKVLKYVESQLRTNKQFFYVADLLLLKILFTSSSLEDFVGIVPAKMDPGYFITRIHPEDLDRYILARSKLFNIAHELFVSKNGPCILSSNFRTMGRDDTYYNMLFQCYSFHSLIPHDTVFLLLVFTDITDFGSDMKKFHYYMGRDISNFRFPDMNLLSIGNVFTSSEFQILQLIEDGYTSEQIAKKLNRSVNTINTHRYHILEKSGKTHTSEVILDLKENGLM